MRDTSTIFKNYKDYLKLTEGVINRNFQLQAHHAKTALASLKSEIAEDMDQQEKEIMQLFNLLREQNRRQKIGLLNKIESHYD